MTRDLTLVWGACDGRLIGAHLPTRRQFVIDPAWRHLDARGPVMTTQVMVAEYDGGKVIAATTKGSVDAAKEWADRRIRDSQYPYEVQR